MAQSRQNQKMKMSAEKAGARILEGSEQGDPKYRKKAQITP